MFLITILSCTRKPEGVQCGSYQATEFGNSTTSSPLYPFLADWVDWESIEEQIPAVQRLQFMDTVEWFNSMYGHTGNPDYIHVLDMNADRAADYVYSGPGPGIDTREMITVIRINSTTLSVLGTLKSLDFEQGMLKGLYLERTAEDDSTNAKTQISYAINYDDTKPALRKFFESEMADSTELPASLYDTYQLRTFCDGPIIIYSKPQPVNLTAGVYVTTSEALVLGEKLDASDKKWLFIAVGPSDEAMIDGDSKYQVGWTLAESR